MAKAQGLEEYRAGSKKNWRGWQWNRIVERLAVPVEEALVLYLCGPEDLDREKALERGFLAENLIAVDKNKANIRKIRKAGSIGIAHDLHETLCAWPHNWSIHVLAADFCSGIGGGAKYLDVIPLWHPP